MKRIKFGISMILVCVLTLVSNTYVFGETEVKKYNLYGLSQKFLEESTAIKKLNIDQELLKLQYDENLKQYNDLSYRADSTKESFETFQKAINDATTQYQNETDPVKKQQIDTYRQSLINSYITVQLGYSEMFKQQIGMMQSMEAIKLQQKQLPQKKENETALAKYNLQKDYYDLYILDQQLTLLKQDLANVRKSLDIEKVKKGLNLSTQTGVESLEKQERALELSVQQMENSRDMAVDNIKTKIGMPMEEELEIELSLPVGTSVRDYSLSQLNKKFMEKSLEMEAARNNTRVQQEIYDRSKLVYSADDNKVKIAELQLKQAQLDEISTQRSLEAYVKQMYYQHIQAKNDLLHKQKSQKLYEENERLLDARNRQGMLSVIDYNLQKQEIQRNYLEVKQAIVAYENMKAQMDLVEKGVMVK